MRDVVPSRLGAGVPELTAWVAGVLQVLLGLSDRDAAEAVRCRTGFKYPLGLGPGDPGFRHSVLGDFRTGFGRREVTCPQGQVSRGWHAPYTTSSSDAAPLIVAKFTRSQCQPCPARAACTTSGDGN